MVVPPFNICIKSYSILYLTIAYFVNGFGVNSYKKAEQ